MSEKIPTDDPPTYEDATPTATAAPPSEPLRKPPPPRPLPPLNLPALNMIRNKRIILASASPRRRQILSQILPNLEIKPCTLPENLPHSLGPIAYVLATAEQKCRHIYTTELDHPTLGEPALVLSADTVIATEFGQILEKPRNEKEHVAMLQMLRDGQGGWHKVYTAVVCMAPLENAVDPGYAMETHVEETAVKFDQSVTDELVVSYVRTREGVDKAGGYGIQGLGSILVEKIEGSFDNVVGLPLRATLQLIESVVVEPLQGEVVEEAL